MLLVNTLLVYWKIWLTGFGVGIAVFFFGGRQFYTLLGMLISVVFGFLLFVPLIIVGIVKLLHL